METKHTPGPWEARFMNGRHGESAIITEAPEFQDDEKCPYHPKIASASCMRGGPPREIAEANARLIASAPDMLRALELILNSDMAQREEDEGNISTELSIARAAYAKATGEQQ